VLTSEGAKRTAERRSMGCRRRGEAGTVRGARRTVGAGRGGEGSYFIG
jgi:hypothetical protein